MNLSIDKSRCIGCGMCAATVPEVFRVVDHVSTVLALPKPLDGTQWEIINGDGTINGEQLELPELGVTVLVTVPDPTVKAKKTGKSKK